MLETLTLAVIFIIIAYLIGSLSSAIILCKLAGLPDPRSQGSGNPGATNVLRFGGKKLAAAVLIIDVLKGAVPVMIVQMFGLAPAWVAASAFAAFIGHLYPLFFAFKGGKGVATALGGFIVLSYTMAGLVLFCWIVIFAITRISSLSAILAAILAPIFGFWMIDDNASQWIITVMAIMLIWRHLPNIQRLLAGQEMKSK